jgi:hypothetical protein
MIESAVFEATLRNDSWQLGSKPTWKAYFSNDKKKQGFQLDSRPVTMRICDSFADLATADTVLTISLTVIE